MYIILDDGTFLNLGAISAITPPHLTTRKAIAKFHGNGQQVIEPTAKDRKLLKAMADLSQRVAKAQGDTQQP